MDKNQLGDFKLVKQIAQDPLGTVFLAEHQFLKRKYAVRIFPEELASTKKFISRFEKEFPLLATLEHPHILKVEDVSCSDGFYYLATDCIVDGTDDVQNLRKYMEGRKDLTEEEVFQIADQVASALDYAHKHNIAHLGLRLENILVHTKDNAAHVYLSDFGISQVIGSGLILGRINKTIVEALSMEGDPSALSKLQLSFLQTYMFLSPEQKVFGDLSKTSVQSDGFSFGVLVYYLLTKRVPEGVLELGSNRKEPPQYHWEELLHELLQRTPEKRPASLTAALESVLPQKAFAHANSFSVSKPNLQVTEKKAAVSLKPFLKPAEIQRPEFIPDPRVAFQKDTTIGRYLVKENESKDVKPLLTEMIVVSGGTFSRGSNQGARDEMPRHNIELSDFAIDIHPVTNEQFVLFLEAMGGEKDGSNLDMIRLRDSRIKRIGGKLSIESGYAKHPVVGVAWYGAVAYAKWVGKRVPTEAEWEIAAAGGLTDALYPTGSNIERPQANFFSSDTTTVMSYPPNEYGLYDMAGNVYEWCQDWYDFHYYDISVQEPCNPKGPHQGVYRVLRGGCWKSLKEDLRIAHRHRNNPGTMNGTYGFRCAADVLTS